MAEMTLEQVLEYLEKRKDHAFSVLDPTDAELNRRSIDAIDAAIKQREQDKLDAARYRWLSQPNNETAIRLLEQFAAIDLDEAIDAAMTKESGQ